MNLRGFISAPLLGTLVFLGAVVFVVHMTQLEKAEVSGIVADIYHNRVTSMLEDYRYDMGSLFAVALSRAIERYLSNECWEVFALKNNNYIEAGGAEGGIATRGVSPAGFAKVSGGFNYDDFPFCLNAPSGQGGFPTCDSKGPFGNGNPQSNANYDFLCAENCNGQLDYYELRYKKCTEISDIIRDGICPYDPRYGLTAWLDSTRRPFNFEGVSFSISNPELVGKFVDQITCDFGSSGKTSNTNLFDYVFEAESGTCKGRNNCLTDLGNSCNYANTGVAGELIVGEGIKACRQLVGDSMFDCRNFATNLSQPYRCCRKYDSKGQCAPDGVVPGCEEGSFFVGVNVLANDEIYRSLPRVNATDKGGNRIQSGALGDDNFTVHVKYPVYKYLDAAFRSYMPIAYGICLNPENPEDDFEVPINMQVHGGQGKGQGGTVRECRSGHGNSPQDNLEGIIEGLCYGKGCNGYNLDPDCVIPEYYLEHKAKCDAFGYGRSDSGQPLPRDRQEALEAARRLFLGTFFDPEAATGVCRLFRPPICGKYGLCDTTVLVRGMNIRGPPENDGFLQLCPKNEADWAEIQQDFSLEAFAVSSQEDCGPGNNEGRCAAAKDLSLTVKFVDKKPETLVNPNANNFCWHMRPTHVNP